MTSNFLLQNSERAEVLIIGPKTFACNNLEHCLTLDRKHVSSICKTAFFHLNIYINYDLCSQCQMQEHSCVHDLEARLL